MNNEKRLTGELEIMDDTYGILRRTGEGDIYVRPSLIRDHRLLRGDQVSGLVVSHPTAPGAIKAHMISVEAVNDQEIRH